MKNAFLRTVSVEPRNDHTIAQKLSATVGNSGNMLFESALATQLSSDVEEIWSLSAIPQDLDLLVLSMSNFISPATNLGVFADAIEKKRIKRVVMVGCGAQAYDFGEQVTLQDGTKRFLSILSERSATIGVRGIYTASILEAMGIKNIDIVGCPSIYWPGAKGWGEFRPRDTDNQRYGIHCTPSGKYRDRVKALIEYGIKNDAEYLCQTEIAYFNEQEKRSRDFAYYMGSPVGAEAMRSYFQTHAKIFFTVDEWVKNNSELDFVLGARFHGNVVTMLAGRPNLLLVFDTRTREMADHFSLPYLDFGDFNPDLPMEHYMKLADFSMFHGAYRTRLVEYIDFFEKNGVPHRFFDQHRALLPDIPIDDVYLQRLSDRLLRNGVLSNIDIGRFQKEAALRLAKGRSEAERNAIEVG